MRGTPGPMSAEVDGCVTCMKCLLVPEMFELDPTVPPVPFRSEVCISLIYFLYVFVRFIFDLCFKYKVGCSFTLIYFLTN